MTASTSSPRLLSAGRQRAALHAAIAWFGGLVAYAGLEHGLGEMLQGSNEPGGLFIESWPDAAAFKIVSGEPALTIVPNLLLAGVLTVIVSVAFGAWAIWFVDRPRGWIMLLGLSVALLLAGGGLAPPVMGVILSLAAGRLHADRAPVGTIAQRFGRRWRWFVGIGVAAYLALVPGMVLASLVITIPEWLVYGVAALAFGCLVLALVSARLADRAAIADVGGIHLR